MARFWVVPRWQGGGRVAGWQGTSFVLVPSRNGEPGAGRGAGRARWGAARGVGRLVLAGSTWQARSCQEAKVGRGDPEASHRLTKRSSSARPINRQLPGKWAPAAAGPWATKWKRKGSGADLSKPLTPITGLGLRAIDLKLPDPRSIDLTPAHHRGQPGPQPAEHGLVDFVQHPISPCCPELPARR